MSYGIPKQRPIVDKIDYDLLALSYREAGWRWHSGFPTATQLEELVTESIMDLSKRTGHNFCSSTGGMYVEWAENCTEWTPENIVVRIHHRLAEHYFGAVGAEKWGWMSKILPMGANSTTSHNSPNVAADSEIP